MKVSNLPKTKQLIQWQRQDSNAHSLAPESVPQISLYLTKLEQIPCNQTSQTTISLFNFSHDYVSTPQGAPKLLKGRKQVVPGTTQYELCGLVLLRVSERKIRAVTVPVQVRVCPTLNYSYYTVSMWSKSVAAFFHSRELVLLSISYPPYFICIKT